MNLQKITKKIFLKHIKPGDVVEIVSLPEKALKEYIPFIGKRTEVKDNSSYGDCILTEPVRGCARWSHPYIRKVLND